MNLSAGTQVMQVAFDTNGSTGTGRVSGTSRSRRQDRRSGLTGQYFDNLDFTALRVTSDRRCGKFRLGVRFARSVHGRRHVLDPVDGAGPAPVQETYTFHATVDDGVRLWVNNQLIIDRWSISRRPSGAGRSPSWVGRSTPFDGILREHGARFREAPVVELVDVQADHSSEPVVPKLTRI